MENMECRRRRNLTSEEILEISEDDNCDDLEFTVDYESSNSDSPDESETSDLGEPDNSSPPPLPPASKAPRLDVWQWDDDDSGEEVVKRLFAVMPGVKRTIKKALGDSPTTMIMFNALLGEDFWQMLAHHTNMYASESRLHLLTLCGFRKLLAR